MATVDGLPPVPLNDPPRCWAMADDEDPDCPIGSARCARADGHDGEHVWESAMTDRPQCDDDDEDCGHHSWAGLMRLLDEHWPEDIFPTKYDDDPKRDAGPRIVSLMRWVDRLRAEADQ
jgi:hypothetical protein